MKPLCEGWATRHKRVLLAHGTTAPDMRGCGRAACPPATALLALWCACAVSGGEGGAGATNGAPRRTFARAGVEAAGSCRLAFDLPLSAAVVEAGPVSVACVCACMHHPCPAVALYHNGVASAPLRRVADGGASPERFTAEITAAEGAHALHAVLLDADGNPTTAVAHASFLSRARVPDDPPPDPSAPARVRHLQRLSEPAARACRGGVVRDDRGGVRTATSPCDALLQLGHELRLAGDWPSASRFLAQVVQESAAHGRKGDLAHHTHVYPYLEIAKGSLAANDRCLNPKP